MHPLNHRNPVSRGTTQSESYSSWLDSGTYNGLYDPCWVRRIQLFDRLAKILEYKKIFSECDQLCITEIEHTPDGICYPGKALFRHKDFPWGCAYLYSAIVIVASSRG